MYSYDHYHAEHYSEVTSAAYEVSAAYLMRHVPTVQRLLDFGCGVGGFLVAAAARGVDAHGVEFHPSAVERAATATGLPVTLLADIEAADAKFDVIHLGDVLEHLPEPEATMRTLAQRLAPNGCFFVEGPIEQNLSVVRAVAATLKTAGRKVGRHASGSLPPFHLTFTTAASQQHFFNTVLKYRTERFDVSETGWPYVSVSGTNHSLSAKVRRLLGTLAVEASRLNAFLPDELKLANRFTAIVRPTGS